MKLETLDFILLLILIGCSREKKQVKGSIT